MAKLLAVSAALLSLVGCGPSIDSSGIHLNGDSHASHPDKAPALNGSWEMRSYKMKDSFGQKITIDPNGNSTLTFKDGVITNNQERSEKWEMSEVSYSVSTKADGNGYYTITFAPNGQKKPDKPAIYTYEIVHVKDKGIRFRPVVDGSKAVTKDGRTMRDLISDGATQVGDYYEYNYYAACPWFQGFEEKHPSACAIAPKELEISEVGNSTIYPARK